MLTTIALVIVAALVVGLGVWSWWFENGKSNSTDAEEKIVGEQDK